jgi:hypothetical protein
MMLRALLLCVGFVPPYILFVNLLVSARAVMVR